MTHVTCRLTAKNRDQLRNATLGNRVRAAFFRPALKLRKNANECRRCLVPYIQHQDVDRTRRGRVSQNGRGHLLAVPRFRLNTYDRRAFSVAGPMAWNSLPDFIRGIQRATQTVLGVHLKRTCSRVTSASSALGVFNDYALYKSTHSLTHREKWRKYVHGVASHRKRTSPICQRRNYSFLGARGQKQ